MKNDLLYLTFGEFIFKYKISLIDYDEETNMYFGFYDNEWIELPKKMSKEEAIKYYDNKLKKLGM